MLMIAAAVIVVVMTTAVLVLNPTRAEWVWFLQLRCPNWLTF